MNTPEDDIYEADIETATGLMKIFQGALESAGLWTNDKHDEEGRIEVRVFSRLGSPIELDTFR